MIKPIDELLQTYFTELNDHTTPVPEATDKAKAQILKIIDQEKVRARLDELESLNTGRHYGKDYQDSLDELDEYVTDRIAELERVVGEVSPTHPKEVTQDRGSE